MLCPIVSSSVGRLCPIFQGLVVLAEPTDVLVSLVSIILLFPIQSNLVLYSSLFLPGLTSFLVLGFAHESIGFAEILAHSRCTNCGVLLL